MFNFGKRIGIDLGTANSLVYLEGEGIVLNEPSVVAVTTNDNRVLAVGIEAKEMLGRTPDNIAASRPLRDGVIADYVITEAMLRYFVDKVCGHSRLFKPEVMICVPAGVTSVERRAVLDATLSAGAKTAYLIDEPLAAAIGAKIPIANPSGNMIVDIGGGTAEAAVICLGGVVVHASVRVGGNKIDEAIQTAIRKKYGLIIGENQAEEVKIRIGSATLINISKQQSNSSDENSSNPASFQSNISDSSSNGSKILSNQNRTMQVRGRDAITGMPRTINLTSNDIHSMIEGTIAKIVGVVKGVLEETPPELASDIIDKGIVLSGGTSQLCNLDKLLTEATGVPCHVAENPLLCVAMGTGIALENLDLYKRSVSKR